jgi:hypothetical protein
LFYFAGLFDAEGYVSLCPNGSFTIAIEMSNEEIPNLFKKHFQGSIYERKRDKRKKTWIWKINSISDQALFFINTIKPYSIIKINQLDRLGDYLDQPRKYRKETRAITCRTLKDFKQPGPLQLHHILPPIEKPIEPHFFEWLAGFIDGDGNFVCNEYIDKRNDEKYFSHQISVSNIFLEAICYINDRIPGCISHLNRGKNMLYKWTCKRNFEKFLCDGIYPFLKLKKSQCNLFMEFITFPKKIRNIPYIIKDRNRMYTIINEIKHLNSL